MATYSHSSKILNQEEIPIQDHLIFSIELILEMILKELNRDDLLTSRQINSFFYYVATKCIQKMSPPISLNFIYLMNKQTYVLTTCEIEAAVVQIPSIQNNAETIITYNNDTTLGSLSNLMKTSWNFPFNSFSFKNGKLHEVSLQKFLYCHGVVIKSLSLDIFDTNSTTMQNSKGGRCFPPRISALKKLLYTQAPYLSWLKLSKFPQEWANSVEGIMPLPKSIQKSDIANAKYLKNLTSLKLGKRDEPIRIIKEIVKFAPCLKTVQTYCFQDVFNGQFHKFHLLRSLYFYPKQENIVQYESFASSLKTSVLKSISINLLSNIVSTEFNDRLSDVLWKLLNASASTLTTLKITLPFGLLFNPTSSLKLKIPQLYQLKCIQISTPELCALFLARASDEFSTTCFCTEFKFDLAFPNVIKVVFKVDNWYTNGVQEVIQIDDTERARNVKCLIFTKADYGPNKCLLYSSQIFQNLTFLEVQLNFCRFLETSQSGLYDFQHLQELQLVIHLSDKENKDYYDVCSAHELEAGLTGLTSFDLQDVYPSISSRFDISFEAEMVFSRQIERFSILNLPELKILQLTFVDQSLDVKRTYPIFLSQVSRFYAFQMRPLLQIKLRFCFQRQENLNNIMETMKPTLPHVQVIGDGQEV